MSATTSEVIPSSHPLHDVGSSAGDDNVISHLRASPRAVPLESVISTSELSTRPARAPEYEAESRAVVALAQYLAQSPGEILHRLVETARQLCAAGSAGISILEADSGAGVFRWHALAGELSHHLWIATPRNFSPCGTCVDHNAVELMTLPERHFRYFKKLRPTIVEALLVPFAADGQTVGTIWVVSHDHQRRFDAEDARLVANLGKFATAAYQIREVDRRKATFLATLAHELRNPLAAVQNALGYLDLRLKSEPDTGIQQVTEIGRRQLKAMVRMIDDLLDASRIARDKLELRVERAELATVVLHAIETSRPHLDATRHVLSVALPPAPVRLNCDPLRLAQAIANLLHNASKFTPDGGRIAIRAEKTQTGIAIRVRDEGIGIPEGKLAQIFEPFVQLDAPHDGARGGLGIGLALVRRLTELHGGTVSAHSAGAGCGSEFVIRLPTSQNVDS
jgi:signal transduction histidine kinase